MIGMFNAKKLFELRNSLRLSRRELGDKIGVTGASIEKWESGTSQPRLSKIYKIAAALEVGPEDLLLINNARDSKVVHCDIVNPILAKISDELVELDPFELKSVLQIIKKYKYSN